MQQLCFASGSEQQRPSVFGEPAWQLRHQPWQLAGLDPGSSHVALPTCMPDCQRLLTAV